MSELPAGWECRPLCEVADVILGQSPPGNSYNVDGEGVAFFQGKAEFGSLYPTVQKWTTQPKKQARKDDILISVRAPVGPTNLAPLDCSIGRGLAALRVREPMPARYLLYAMRASAGALASEATGTTFPAITGSQLKAHPIAVAPLDEQQRIVEVIEEQFSRLDAGVESLQRAKRNLTRLRASVLNAAMDGRLVGTPVGEFDRARVDEIAAVQLGRQRSPKHHRGRNMRPYLRAANVTWHGISLDDVKEMDFPPEDFQRYRLNPGDILLNEASGSPNEVGKPAIWNGEIPGACFQNTLLRVVPSEGIDRKFLHLCFMEAAQNGGFASVARGVNIMHLGKAGLAAWKVPTPSIETQESIVAEVDRQFSILDAIAAAIGAGLARAHKLRRSILREAFAGRLTTAQDALDLVNA